MSDKWLDKLEAQVKKTSTRIRALRDDNETLKKQAKALEKKLDESSDSSAAEDWKAERDGIRERVQALSDRLESLLEEDAETPSD